MLCRFIHYADGLKYSDIIVLFSLQISVMTKLVPSPDWFIGLDSLDLCSQGSFVESVTTEVMYLYPGSSHCNRITIELIIVSDHI